jgi:hypothetical protein
VEPLVVVAGQAVWKAPVKELFLYQAGPKKMLEQRYGVTEQPVG